MYARILVPVDGSSTSDIALREAIKLASGQKAALRIVFVIEDVVPMWDMDLLNINEIREALRQTGRRVLAKAEAMVREAGIKAETKLIETRSPGERIASMIVAEAKVWSADLIVIGTHGRRGDGSSADGQRCRRCGSRIAGTGSADTRQITVRPS